MRKPPARILYVIPGLPAAGAEKALLRLVSGIDRSLFSPVVLSLAAGGSLAADFREAGIEVHQLGLGSPLKGFFALPQIVSHVKKLKPALIHGWLFSGALSAQIASCLSGPRVPCLWSIRGGIDKGANIRPHIKLMLKVLKLLQRFPEAVIFNSKSVENQFLSEGFKFRHAACIPNGFPAVDSPQKSVQAEALTRKLGLKPGTVLAGVLGRYHRVKGHEVLLKAALGLCEKFPDLHYVMAGKGLDDTNLSLKAIVQGSALESRTHFIGEVKDTFPYLSGLSFFINPSLSESFPNAVCEAMLCGTPCLVTDTGESKEIVGNTGKVVTPGSVEALSQGISEFLLDNLKQLEQQGLAARERVLSLYTESSFIKAHEEIYRKLVTL